MKGESAASKSESRAGLTSGSITGSTSKNITGLTSENITGLTSESIAELTSESIAGMTSESIAALTSRSSSATTSESSAASTSESNRFRQYVSLARDLAIGAGVLPYFIGFVYIYYYFDNFGLGVIATKLDPPLVYMFAWEVIRREPFSYVLLVAGILIFGFWFNYAMDALAEPEPIALRIENTMQRLGAPLGGARLLRRLLQYVRSLVAIAPVFLVLLVFVFLFIWSRRVATADGSDQFVATHFGIRKSVELIETPDKQDAQEAKGARSAFPAPYKQSVMDQKQLAKANNKALKERVERVERCVLGTNVYDVVEPSTFAELLQKINDASSCGRVVQVAETEGSIVFLVSTPNPDLDNPSKRDPNDRVYIIEKSLIAAEELWSR